ncbi:RNA polymerase sigma factor [Kordiimonas sp.]|uniref:RNA polymerase sigma factor n=1 Tax=Kordiimonas sp. TaxID=1970157 RepID=UPI003B52B92F
MFDWAKLKTDKPQASTVRGRSLEELFRLQRGPLIRFAAARLKDDAEAEEIVQEAFIRFQNKYDVANTASPEALLARIIANLVIDKVRERNARAAREDAWGKANTAGADDDMSASVSVDPSRALVAKQELAAAMQALEELPKKTRQIFLLHRFEELSHAEISERTGIPKSTIEKHMIRAIKALAISRSQRQ